MGGSEVELGVVYPAHGFGEFYTDYGGDGLEDYEEDVEVSVDEMVVTVGARGVASNGEMKGYNMKGVSTTVISTATKTQQNCKILTSKPNSCSPKPSQHYTHCTLYSQSHSS